MDNQSFLLFSVQELHYAVDVTQVLEIIKLPELIPVAHLPDDIIGLLNYRGYALPVMHLSRRLGRSQDPCQISDRLIVMEWPEGKIGIIVDAVEDVQPIALSQISLDFSLSREADTNAAFLAGMVTMASEVVMVLNLEALIYLSEQVTTQIANESAILSDALQRNAVSIEPSLEHVTQAPAESPPPDSTFADFTVAETIAQHEAAELIGRGFFQRYCPEATPEEQALFRQRAEALRPTQQSQATQQALSPVAIMRLGKDYFGLDLTAVREFIPVASVTPVPCCPKHIVGNMNLRGEVMTLVDIRAALRVSEAAELGPKKAVIIDANDIVAGIAVDQVCDILQLSPSEISPIPATASSSESYFTGMTAYRTSPVGILDFPKLVKSEKFIVDEAV